MKNIAVAGAGIIGLTSACSLLNRGHKVTIFCEKKPLQTTSTKAGAVWLPFLTQPKESVNRWAKYSYGIFGDQVNKNEGVEWTELHVFANSEEELDFHDLLPKDNFSLLKKTDLPAEVKSGCKMKVPLMEPPKYLEIFQEKLLQAGVKIIQQKLNSLLEIDSGFDLVINCAGLGARELVNDQTVIPISGQIVKTEKMEGVRCFTNKSDTDHPVYLFPRNDGCILGGSALPNDFSEIPDPARSQNILQRVMAVEPKIRNAKMIDCYVGLRPWRPSVRLEKENDIIHNYGHGGSGWTVSWGCAKEVVELAEQ